MSLSCHPAVLLKPYSIHVLRHRTLLDTIVILWRRITSTSFVYHRRVGWLWERARVAWQGGVMGEGQGSVGHRRLCYQEGLVSKKKYKAKLVICMCECLCCLRSTVLKSSPMPTGRLSEYSISVLHGMVSDWLPPATNRLSHCLTGCHGIS